MTTTEIVEFLARYNRWRRGDESLAMESPRNIGDALDSAGDRLVAQSREIADLKRMVEKLKAPKF